MNFKKSEIKEINGSNDDFELRKKDSFDINKKRRYEINLFLYIL